MSSTTPKPQPASDQPPANDTGRLTGTYFCGMCHQRLEGVKYDAIPDGFYHATILGAGKCHNSIFRTNYHLCESCRKKVVTTEYKDMFKWLAEQCVVKFPLIPDKKTRKSFPEFAVNKTDSTANVVTYVNVLFENWQTNNKHDAFIIMLERFVNCDACVFLHVPFGHITNVLIYSGDDRHGDRHQGEHIVMGINKQNGLIILKKNLCSRAKNIELPIGRISRCSFDIKASEREEVRMMKAKKIVHAQDEKIASKDEQIAELEHEKADLQQHEFMAKKFQRASQNITTVVLHVYSYCIDF